jgi:uncharacterized protein (DUF2141 family)
MQFRPLFSLLGSPVRHRSRDRAALWALGALGALGALALALPAASEENSTSVTITVTNLRNARGIVQACLTALPDHFPDCSADPAAHHMSVNARAGLVLEFHEVPPGTYAVALLHDENGNGRIDRLLMVPREGYGFSRDAPVRMGPPSFEQAAFRVGTTPVSQTIRMRYLL